MYKQKNIDTLSRSTDETKNIARDFIKELINNKNNNETKVILLHGDLGSGKTTFVMGVLNFFDINPHSASPTFVIMKKYSIDDKNIKYVYHIDAYRIKSLEEIKTIGLKKIITDKNNIIFIEWPENIKGFNFGSVKEINFDYGENENERLILFSCTL